MPGGRHDLNTPRVGASSSISRSLPLLVCPPILTRCSMAVMVVRIRAVPAPRSTSAQCRPMASPRRLPVIARKMAILATFSRTGHNWADGDCGGIADLPGLTRTGHHQPDGTFADVTGSQD